MRRDLIRALVIGVAVTLSLAWLAPPLLFAFLPSTLQYSWSDLPGVFEHGGDRVSVGRNWLIDWWQYSLGSAPLIADPNSGVPRAVARPRDERDARRWDRIDTGLTGFPFRAFASEAWWAAGSDGMGTPEFRGNFHLGRIGQREVLIPLIPLWAGLVADVVAWAIAAHLAWMIPRAVRRYDRKRRGACIWCGHDRRGVERCSECGRV
ncbi:MAG: hypothetical protein U0572_07205 [Phycisphaerales bacterium]